MTRLFLTTMAGPNNLDNLTEIIEPIHEHLDGIVVVLNDCGLDSPEARYLETVKGVGKIICRSFLPRYDHLMNETLFSGAIDEGALCIWVDPLERPMKSFVSRIKTEIDSFMVESDVGMLAYYGKAYLFRYTETARYQGSPHWGLTGISGRAIEWSQIEPDEKQVRWNVRPLKRTEPYHWVKHLLRYHLFPAGSNSALLGLDHWPGGQTQENWAKRERNRLELRAEMRRRGYPITVDGFVDMCKAGLDDKLKEHLRADKTFSDGYHYLVCGRTEGLIDSHKPADAIPIE